MSKKPQPNVYDSSNSSVRVNSNYSVRITFDDNRRGTVELRGHPDTVEPWSKGKTNVKPNTPLDR